MLPTKKKRRRSFNHLPKLLSYYTSLISFQTGHTSLTFRGTPKQKSLFQPQTTTSINCALTAQRVSSEKHIHWSKSTREQWLKPTSTTQQKQELCTEGSLPNNENTRPLYLLQGKLKKCKPRRLIMRFTKACHMFLKCLLISKYFNTSIIIIIFF